jgi:hypothetical protein
MRFQGGRPSQLAVDTPGVFSHRLLAVGVRPTALADPTPGRSGGGLRETMEVDTDR